MLASIPMLILQEYLMYLVQAHYGFGVTNLAWLVTPDDQRDRERRVRAVRRLTVDSAVATWIGGMMLGTS